MSMLVILLLVDTVCYLYMYAWRCERTICVHAKWESDAAAVGAVAHCIHYVAAFGCMDADERLVWVWTQTTFRAE
jgi:hypothetical protein